MGWIEAIVLGLVQGLTEFLPISSSAHLRVVGEAFGWEDPGAAFTAITQIGTETAVVIYFRKDIWRIIKAWFGALPVGPWKNTVPRTDPDARMGWFVILAPHAVKRLIEPEEVAGVVAFLLGPDGRAFTGAPVTMDLGWTAR